MSEASIIGNPAMIEKLLKAGADVNSPNADGQTALMVVARSGKVEAAQSVVESWRRRQRQRAMAGADRFDMGFGRKPTGNGEGIDSTWSGCQCPVAGERLADTGDG